MLFGKVSASFPEGLTAPVRTSAIAPPPAWPPSQASMIALTLSAHGMVTAEPFIRTTATFGCTLADSFDELLMTKRHIKRRPVKTFRFVAVWQACKDDRNLGFHGRLPSFVEKALCDFALTVVSNCIDKLLIVTGDLGEFVVGVGNSCRVDLRAAGTLIARQFSECTDNGDSSELAYDSTATADRHS